MRKHHHHQHQADWITVSGAAKEFVQNALEMNFLFGPAIDAIGGYEHWILGLSKNAFAIAAPLSVILAIASMLAHYPVYRNHQKDALEHIFHDNDLEKDLLNESHSDSHGHSHGHPDAGKCFKNTTLALDYATHLCSIAGTLTAVGLALYKQLEWPDYAMSIWIATSVVLSIVPAYNDIRVCRYHMFHSNSHNHDHECGEHGHGVKSSPLLQIRPAQTSIL